MASLETLSAPKRYLIWALVQIARADGDLSPLEATYVERVAERLELDEPSRETIRAALLGQAPLPEVAPPAAHEQRVQVYRDAVTLASSDGDVERDEHEILDGVAAKLALGADEVDRIWREARAEPA